MAVRSGIHRDPFRRQRQYPLRHRVHSRGGVPAWDRHELHVAVGLTGQII
jgi:hypothetical protein